MLSVAKLEERFLSAVLFLIPALLLTTPKWSVAVVSAFVVYALYLLIKKGVPRLTFFDKLLIACFVIYFASAIPAFVVEGFRARFLDIPSRYLVAIVLLLGITHVGHKLKIDWYYRGTVIGALGTFVVVCYEYFVLDHPRVGGFMSFSINYGYLAAALSSVCLCACFYFDDKRAKGVALLGFAAAVAAVSLTGTRGAWIAVPPVALMILILLRSRLGLRRIVLSFALALAACLITYKYVEPVKSRVDFTLEELTISSKDPRVRYSAIGIRLIFWQAALKVIGESPLRGMSRAERIDFFTSLVEDGEILEVRDRDLSNNHAHAHNQLLEAGASLGAPGILSLLLVYFVPAYHFWRQRERNNVVGTTGCAFILSFMLFGISETPLLNNLISVYFLSSIVIFWVVLSRQEQQ